MRNNVIIRLTALNLIFLICVSLLHVTSWADQSDETYLTADPSKLSLPIVYIDTEDGEEITTREFYKNANFSLEGEYEGNIQIKGRGNSTWWQFSTKKRAFTIKLDDATDLLGLGKARSWVLLANFMDQSNMRNKFAYDLSAALGMTYVPSEYVNVVFNGEYYGIYQLCRKIDCALCDIQDFDEIAEDYAQMIAQTLGYTAEEQEALEEQMKTDYSWLTTGRIGNIKLNKDNFDFPSISQGGIILELDEYYDEYSKFKSSMKVSVMVREPEYLATNTEYMQELINYINEFESAISSPTFTSSTGKHYSEYIDIDSFVDYYIINALMLNVEFGYKSMYCYINSEGKIVMGPCWDYDWSSGNHFLGSSGTYQEWYNDQRSRYNKWYQALYGDPLFINLVRQRWFEIQDEIQTELGSLDEIYRYLKDSAALEQACYLSDPDEVDYRNQYHGYSLENEYTELKLFLQNRINWMSEQLAKRDPNIRENGKSYGFEGSENLILDISSDSEYFTVDSYQLTDCPANYTILDSEPCNFLIQANVKDESITSVCFYINGHFINQSEVINGSVQLAITDNNFDDGINTVYAIALKGNVYKYSNYISVRMPYSDDDLQDQTGEEIIEVTTDSLNQSDIDDISNNSNTVRIIAISVISFIIISATITVLIILIRKRSKKDTNI